MRRLKNIGIAALLSLGFAACGDMLDNIRPYLDQGETIYVGKADSLYAREGCNRIELVARLRSGFSQTRCRIVATDQNGVSDTVFHAVERENGEQYLHYMYTDLAEGSYDFGLVLFDDVGNRSLTTTVSAYAYGDFYQSTLFNRRLNRIEKRGDSFVLNWRTVDSALYTVLTYDSTEGTKKRIEIPVTEYATEIQDCIEGSEFVWVTAYEPSENALDIFYTSENKATFLSY